MVSGGQSMQESPEASRCQCLPLRCGFPDQFIGLNGITVPGTLRDSLVLLSVVLEQQTELQPTEIMTDTGAYTDTMFGIFHFLGYQFSPRLADIGGSRFWRVDQKANYGALNALAAQRINTTLIAEHWEDLLRLAGSLKLGTVQASGLIRTLQTKDRPTKLACALEELGRQVKTLYLLSFAARGTTCATRMSPDCPPWASIRSTCSVATSSPCPTELPVASCGPCVIQRSPAMSRVESNFRFRCYRTPKVESGPTRGTDDEAIKVCGRADHRGSTGDTHTLLELSTIEDAMPAWTNCNRRWKGFALS
jgi:hypothetical protein